MKLPGMLDFVNRDGTEKRMNNREMIVNNPLIWRMRKFVGREIYKTCLS